MTTTARATFTLDGWDEQPYAERAEGRKLTRATSSRPSRGTSPATARSSG